MFGKIAVNMPKGKSNALFTKSQTIILVFIVIVRTKTTKIDHFTRKNKLMKVL
jgi:hypothetical protein